MRPQPLGYHADRADYQAADGHLDLGPLGVVRLDDQLLVELPHGHARLDLHDDDVTRLDLELLGLLGGHRLGLADDQARLRAR